MTRSRAVFMDRDGTLMEDVGYPRDPAQVRLLPGVTEALRRLHDAGFLLVIVSNQSGVGRGLISPEQATAVHRRLMEMLGEDGVSLDQARYCPHAPEDGCDCRKPSPSMLIDAAFSLDIDLSVSYMIGDKRSDVEAGRRAGCRTILLESGGGETAGADHLVSDLSGALAVILPGVPA
ncbi:MAG: HAD family hydrolase [Actinomycetota bacterium]|nr:HAD family hydrolase [Actinomycetota bacterium]